MCKAIIFWHNSRKNLPLTVLASHRFEWYSSLRTGLMEYLFVCVLKLNRQIYVESLLGVHGHAPPALIYVSVGNLIYTYTYKHIYMLMLYIFSTQNRTSFTAALAWLEYCENVFVKSRHIHTAEHNIVAKFAIRLA